MEQFTSLLKSIRGETKKISSAGEVYDLSLVTQITVEAALKLGVPCFRYKNSPLIIFEKNGRSVFLTKEAFSTTNSFAVSLARNKFLTHEVLRSLGIKTPKSILISEEKNLAAAASQFSLSDVVLKPNESSRGFLVRMGAKNHQELVRHFRKIKQMRDEAILEKRVRGGSYRALVINHKVISVVFQKRATIIGTGTKTALELIRELNKKRLASGKPFPQAIRINQDLKDAVRSQNFTLDDILPLNKKLTLSKTSNLSRGSQAHDVTDKCPPETKEILGKITKHFNLDIAGIDIISPNISSSIKETGVILEINARPGFYGHVYPVTGPGAPVGEEVIKYLF